MKKIVLIIPTLFLASCDLMGWYECESLSGWCQPKKPAAIDFWDIKNEKEPTLEDFKNKLPDGRISVNDYAMRSAMSKYSIKKVKIFEMCNLDWRERSPDLIKIFKPEGFRCLETNGLYRNSLSEDTRW